MKLLIPLTALLLLGACSSLDKVGDEIDAACEDGTLDATQRYVDRFNSYLESRERKFRVDGLTCV